MLKYSLANGFSCFTLLTNNCRIMYRGFKVAVTIPSAHMCRRVSDQAAKALAVYN